jgi:hypothetical protein
MKPRFQKLGFQFSLSAEEGQIPQKAQGLGESEIPYGGFSHIDNGNSRSRNRPSMLVSELQDSTLSKTGQKNRGH